MLSLDVIYKSQISIGSNMNIMSKYFINVPNNMDVCDKYWLSIHINVNLLLYILEKFGYNPNLYMHKDILQIYENIKDMINNTK